MADLPRRSSISIRTGSSLGKKHKIKTKRIKASDLIKKRNPTRLHRGSSSVRY